MNHMQMTAMREVFSVLAPGTTLKRTAPHIARTVTMIAIFVGSVGTYNITRSAATITAKAAPHTAVR